MPSFRVLIILVSLIAPSLSFTQVLSPSGKTLQFPKATDGDPFEISNGIYYREYDDLFVKDSIPIKFSRTQRNMDPMSRAFGIGGSTSYDMFIIGDTIKFSWVALVFADGSQARYSRISQGTGYADGVFKNRSGFGEFADSTIYWKDGGWTVEMRNKSEYRVHGCNATSRPGQCGVMGYQNPDGERLTIQRDREGNLLRITSPHGHFIEMKNDSGGRILRAQDDAGKWAGYTYDDKGALTKSSNWRGDHQTFGYDAHFNMTSIHEWGPAGRDGGGRYRFSIINRFDSKDRFASQTVSNGYWSSAKYHVDGNGTNLQTDVRAPEGLTKYFFDEVGWLMREEFTGGSSKWSFAYLRDPRTNELRDAVLTCPSGTLHLPLKMARQISTMGEIHRVYLSEACRVQNLNSDAATKTEPVVK